MQKNFVHGKVYIPLKPESVNVYDSAGGNHITFPELYRFLLEVAIAS